MKYNEIIAERSLSDVGVRGGKFYLSASGEKMNIPHFVQTGELDGVKGVSSTKYIWADFSPNAGRDIFFVMNAADVLRQNKLKRVGYDNPDALIADNSKMIGRILSVSDVSKGPCDNLIQGVFQRMPGIKEIQGDPIAVANRAQSIAHILQRGRDFEDNDMQKVDTSKFGDWKSNGLRLSSYDDYANLYYQGAKAAGWYGTSFVQFFAPQNRSRWLPALKAGLIGQANIYADESEWVNEGAHFIVPKSSLVILAVPQAYWNGRPELTKFGFIKKPEGIGMAWSAFDQKRLEYSIDLVSAFANSDFKVQLVEAGKVSNQLVRTQGKRRGY